MRVCLKTSILFVVLFLAACASEPSKKQTLNEQAVSAMQAGNMDEAEHLLTQDLQENPQDVKAMYNFGVLYQRTNRPALAREYYQKVIDGADAAVKNGMDPNEVAQLTQMAHDNIASLDREEAARQEAVQQKPAETQQAERTVVMTPESTQVKAPVQAPVMKPSTQVTGHQIQTGAYSIPANAEEMRDMLTGKHASLLEGKQVNMVKIDGLLKVRIGPYSTNKEANKACRSFKRAGIDCFLVK